MLLCLMTLSVLKKIMRKKVVKVLVRSPLYEEGMTDDEILSVHGILSYAQVMEWKRSASV